MYVYSVCVCVSERKEIEMRADRNEREERGARIYACVRVYVFQTVLSRKCGTVYKGLHDLPGQL